MTMVDDHRVVDPTDPFPIGMRVLAVDDDPTCLVILKTLLQKCQYNVTTTDNAITALKLLRENKNKFDLVISDVHMPDMDGFKLLELVGLEMDLPVIMLSVNDDPRMMMKGITHGACFYLLKPVRVEDLKNIWQHVIRRKKVDSKEKNKTNNQDKPDSGSCNELVSPVTENSDQNAKPTKKRKDQDEDDDEDHEHGHDYEDPSSQKKPRVVWSPELHRKFISAIEQLGIDKAVPKKILDLMNVEKLTRENVASHLQKYRLYLRKMNNMANQQANMMATLGSADPSSYLRMSPLSGVGHFQALSGSGQFHNNGFRSFSPGGMISRLNSPAGLNVHGFPSSGTLQLAQAKNLNNSTNDHQLQYPSALVRGNQNLLSVGLDQFQHNKGVSSVQNLTTLIDGKPGFHPISNRLAEQRLKVTIGGSTSPILGVSNNALMLEQNPQGSQGVGIYDNPTSLLSQHSELSVPLLDHGRCSDIWSSAVHSSGTNSYPSSECFRLGAISPADNLNSSTFQGANLSGASSITSLSSQSHDSLADMHSQGGIFTNNPRQISNNVPFQGWDDHNQNANYHSNVVGNNSINSLTPMDGLIDPTNSTNRNLEFDFCDPLQMKHDGIIDLTEETSLKHHQLYTMDQQKSQNSRISNNVGSLEDLVSEMMKQKQDMVKLSDGDFLCDDNYSGGTAT